MLIILKKCHNAVNFETKNVLFKSIGFLSGSGGRFGGGPGIFLTLVGMQ